MAVETVPPGVRPAESIDRLAEWPVPRRLTTLLQTLYMGLDSRLTWAHRPLDQLIGAQVRAPLARSFDRSLQEALPRVRKSRHDWTGSWYAAQEPSRVAHYDALRRAAGVVFTTEQTRLLDLWVGGGPVVRLVVAPRRACASSPNDRPTCTPSRETNPGRSGCTTRTARPCGTPTAGTYTPGTARPVPAWVITDPSVERIAREPNVEIRRCAIERIGWASYIERAGLRLVATAPDPGNPGSELRLYDMRAETKVLLAVNGSVERDGRRRQYGLTVPGFLRDPVDAAGWTYGLSAEQYSQLVRRT